MASGVLEFAVVAVFGCSSSCLSVSSKVWCRSSNQPTALPKRSLSDLVWRQGVAAFILPTVRDCPLGQKVKASIAEWCWRMRRGHLQRRLAHPVRSSRGEGRTREAGPERCRTPQQFARCSRSRSPPCDEAELCVVFLPIRHKQAHQPLGTGKPNQSPQANQT